MDGGRAGRESLVTGAGTRTERAAMLAYGVACYVLFLGCFVYAAGFVGGFGVPTRLDGIRATPLWTAMGVDLGLLLLFAVQHSVMARGWFKRWWTRRIPEAAERSTYVLFSTVALALLMALWQPIGGVVWHVEQAAAVWVIYGLFAVGWLTVLAATFMINHFHLVGLQQVWDHFRGRGAAETPFRTPGLYKWVRHPLYVGWLLGFWAVPVMTGSHLLFAIVTTVYILAAIRWEERDLMRAHPEYAGYRRRVGMLWPRMRRSDP